MKIKSIFLYFLLLVAAYVNATTPSFLLGAPDDSITWDVTDYSRYKTANQYLETYPEHQDFSNFPNFTWDSVPRWLAIRSGERFTDSDVEAIANNFQMVMLEKYNMQGLGSTEAGIFNAAERIKAVNPNIKTLLRIMEALSVENAHNEWPRI